MLYVKSVLIFTFRNKSLLHTTVNHDYSTRNKVNYNLNLPQITRSTIHRSTTYYGPKFYNLLPIMIKKINNIKLFSKRLNTFIDENKSTFIRILTNA